MDYYNDKIDKNKNDNAEMWKTLEKLIKGGNQVMYFANGIVCYTNCVRREGNGE